MAAFEHDHTPDSRERRVAPESQALTDIADELLEYREKMCKEDLFADSLPTDEEQAAYTAALAQQRGKQSDYELWS